MKAHKKCVSNGWEIIGFFVIYWSRLKCITTILFWKAFLKFHPRAADFCWKCALCSVNWIRGRNKKHKIDFLAVMKYYSFKRMNLCWNESFMVRRNQQRNFNVIKIFCWTMTPQMKYITWIIIKCMQLTCCFDFHCSHTSHYVIISILRQRRHAYLNEIWIN